MATIQEIVEYSKKNPESDYAKQARKHIENGDFDAQAKKEGYDLSWAGRPTLQYETPVFKTGGFVGDALENTVNIIKESPKKISESVNKSIDESNVLNSMRGKADQILGGVARVAETAFAPITGTFQAITDSVSKAIENNPDIVEHPITQKLADIVLSSSDKIKSVVDKNPQLAQEIGDAISIAMSYYGAKSMAKPTTDIVKTVKSRVDDLVSSTKNVTENIKTGTKKVIMGKSEADILSTPIEKVHSLTPDERKIWFDAKKSEISSIAEKSSQKISSTYQNKTTALQEEFSNLQKELSIASRDKVIELRPKIKESMRKQSEIYRDIVSEEMSGKENIPIKISELKNYIDSRFVDDPQLANVIKNKLGLDTPLEPNQNAPFKTSLGELYDKTKLLKQDISAGSKKGTKTFSYDDKLVDDAINTLTGFMKEKGVDFSKANKFWSEYAPIRNQLVSEARPFNISGTQTKQFAGTLKRVATEADVNNENFIKQVSDLLGEDILKEDKAIFSKVNANKKSQIANEIEKQSKLLETQLEKETKLAKLNSEQIEILRKARLRELSKNIITRWIPGLVGANWVTKQLTGFGL